jgi:hypothetical protein
MNKPRINPEAWLTLRMCVRRPLAALRYAWLRFNCVAAEVCFIGRGGGAGPRPVDELVFSVVVRSDQDAPTCTGRVYAVFQRAYLLAESGLNREPLFAVLGVLLERKARRVLVGSSRLDPLWTQMHGVLLEMHERKHFGAFFECLKLVAPTEGENALWSLVRHPSRSMDSARPRFVVKDGEFRSYHETDAWMRDMERRWGWAVSR